MVTLFVKGDTLWKLQGYTFCNLAVFLKNDKTRNVEKREFNHIFSKENDADDMLELLLKNKVTPTSLRDILEDFVLV